MPFSALAVEYAPMPDARLEVMRLQILSVKGK
jgi:hypothetical protein